MDDDDGLSIRNWGYYEPPSFKEHLGLQLMSPLGDHRDSKPFVPSMENPNASGYHHQPLISSHYMRDSWMQRERLLHMYPGNSNFDLGHNTSASGSGNVMQAIESDLGMNLDDLGGDDGDNDNNDNDNDNNNDGYTGVECPPKKRPRSVGKKPKKVKESGNPTGQRAKVMRWNLDMVINGVEMDITGIPIPVCSCTGTPQPCYRWGSGGWQSACCTTTISMYPLPMSTKRRGARIAGRKMSQGAFKKVLEKLASDGYDFGNAIDLKSHWAKHGTNKFVTIR